MPYRKNLKDSGFSPSASKIILNSETLRVRLQDGGPQQGSPDPGERWEGCKRPAKVKGMQRRGEEARDSWIFTGADSVWNLHGTKKKAVLCVPK